VVVLVGFRVKFFASEITLVREDGVLSLWLATSLLDLLLGRYVDHRDLRLNVERFFLAMVDFV
jgi:hypothetical protein